MPISGSQCPQLWNESSQGPSCSSSPLIGTGELLGLLGKKPEQEKLGVGGRSAPAVLAPGNTALFQGLG